MNELGNIRFDCALTPQALTAQSETISSYYDMSKYKKAIFIVEMSSNAGTYGTTGGVILRRIQAASNTGAGAVTAGSSAEVAMGSTYTISSTSYVLNKASYVILTCNTSVASAATVVINGITYTHGSAGTSDFSISRTLVTSSGPNSAAHLGAYINHEAYGVPGVSALVSSNTITLTADNKPISVTITGSNSSGGWYVSGFRQVGYMMVDSAELASASSMRYVAIGITPGSSHTFAVTLLRAQPRYSVDPADIHGDDTLAG